MAPRIMALTGIALGLGLAGAGIARQAATPAPARAPAAALKPASAFAGIADRTARSVALFEEAGKVIRHPRCVNCHPRTDRPLQTDAGTPHQPLVVRGADGHGAPGLECRTCHQLTNVDSARVPGHPDWHLAPASMAWEGKSLGDICRQIKDRARNGNKSLTEIHHHMAEDSLVGWGWNPGAGRTPAPGTQAEFGALIKAWIDTGAACPA
ncbi:hypothetical protein NX02_26445 [Sphingomonas sanxanigenens DSM 19645 = NX02]|uniref:Isoquinoline 1-oxidoreductase subunit n=2 Tax=Sphingomonas sanxanigenens TaxID=397260 RepID=W0AKQ6_9SPHN|nr:hypothetical protein NX02_26445 [Sphingomonas sanxanigenens DSM 19645 = NX02]